MRRYAFIASCALALAAGGYLAVKAARIFFAEYGAYFPHRERHAIPQDAIPYHLKEISFRSRDGVQVAGWSMPSRNGAVVVFLHGSPGDRSGFLPLLGGLNASGYGAILLDMPGHGESGGRADWGISSQLAVEGAIDLALDEPGVTQVALFGYSMGGCVAAQVAMRDARVKALVLLSTFTKLADALHFGYRTRVPMLDEFAVLAARAGGVRVDDMLAIDALRASPPRPVLIVGGTADRTIPVSMLEALYEAARGPKELWIVEGAGHLRLRDTASPEVFDGRLRRFLDNAMLPRRNGVV